MARRTTPKRIQTRCVAILDTMWGGEGIAPGLFRINPQNHSGRRLYWLLGHEDLWVTNACPEYVEHSKVHGKPDPEWLAGNLRRIDFQLLLVCGSVAKKTLDQAIREKFFKQESFLPETARIVYIPHPAARGWTRFKLDTARDYIQAGVH